MHRHMWGANGLSGLLHWAKGRQKAHMGFLGWTVLSTPSWQPSPGSSFLCLFWGAFGGGSCSPPPSNVVCWPIVWVDKGRSVRNIPRQLWLQLVWPSAEPAPRSFPCRRPLCSRHLLACSRTFDGRHLRALLESVCLLPGGLCDRNRV